MKILLLALCASLPAQIATTTSPCGPAALAICGVAAPSVGYPPSAIEAAGSVTITFQPYTCPLITARVVALIGGWQWAIIQHPQLGLIGVAPDFFLPMPLVGYRHEVVLPRPAGLAGLSVHYQALVAWEQSGWHFAGSDCLRVDF
jgi:hypothetical protein